MEKSLKFKLRHYHTFRWYFYPLIMVITINDVICFANKSQKFDIRIIVRQLATEVPKELPSREGKPL